MHHLGGAGQRDGLDADALTAEDVEHELGRTVVAVDLLVVLEELHALEVLVEEVGAVHGAALGLRVELGGEDGAGLVHHALVAAVIEVDKVLLEVAGQGARVDGVAVVLAGDVALTGGQVEGGNVVGAVAVLQLNGAGAGGQSQKLVAKADAHDGDGRGLHEAAKVVDGLLAMGGVTGAVGDEDTVKVRGNLVDGVVVGEDSDGGTTADKAAHDVFLDTAIDEGDVEVGTGRLDNEGRLGAHALDKVDLAGVDEALILVGVVLVTDGDPSKGRTLLSEVGDNFTGVDARDGRHTLAGAPLAEALDGGPVAVLLGDISDDHACTLNVRRFEVLQELPLVELVGGNTIVANEGLGEDENLTTVGGVGHGLGVANERGGEDGFAGDVGVGTKGTAGKDGTVANGKGGVEVLSGSGATGLVVGHGPAGSEPELGSDAGAQTGSTTGGGFGEVHGQLGKHDVWFEGVSK